MKHCINALLITVQRYCQGKIIVTVNQWFPTFFCHAHPLEAEIITAPSTPPKHKNRALYKDLKYIYDGYVYDTAKDKTLRQKLQNRYKCSETEGLV